jgi:hypothetical protein
VPAQRSSGADHGGVAGGEVRGQVTLSLFTDVENVSSFHPPGHHDQAVTTMLDQVIVWSRAMNTERERAQTGNTYRS